MFNDGAKQLIIKDANSSDIEKEDKNPEASVSFASTVDPLPLNVSQTIPDDTTDDASCSAYLDKEFKHIRETSASESSTPASKESIEEAIKKIQARSAKHAVFFQEQMRIATRLDDLDFKIKNRYGYGYDLLVHKQTTTAMWESKKSKHDAKNEAMVTLASFAPGGECCPSKPLSKEVEENDESNLSPRLTFR